MTVSKIMRENNYFYIFIPSDLDLWPSDLKFAYHTLLSSSPMFSLNQKFLYGFPTSRKMETRTDWQTDSVQHLMQLLHGGPHNNIMLFIKILAKARKYGASEVHHLAITSRNLYLHFASSCVGYSVKHAVVGPFSVNR